MSDDNEVLRLCREIADLRQRISAIPGGCGSMTRVMSLAAEKERLVERLADLACSTDEARRARAYVLYERTSLPGNTTQMLAHAVACDMLEPR